MVPLKDNIDLECFLVTKHSWKGKYKRILSIGSSGISTYNPDKFDLTNRWAYADIVAAAPNKTSSVIQTKSVQLDTQYLHYMLIYCF